MIEYVEKVRRAAAARNGAPLYNGSVDHAAVLAEAMFAHADKSVDILTGELNARVYGSASVLDRVKEFLGKSSRKVRVLVEEPELIDRDEHPFFVAFSDRSDVEFRELPAELSKRVPYHFMVMDDDCYRYENDKLKFEAVAAFGDSVGGKKLSDIFETLWDASKTGRLVSGHRRA